MIFFNFAVKSNTSHTYMEKEKLWCGRIAMIGEREIVLVSQSAVVRHMQSIGIVGVDPQAFIRDLRAEGIKAAADAGVVFYHITVGEGSYLFTPADYIVRETVKGCKDSSGMRYSMVIPTDKKGMVSFGTLAKANTTL